MTTKPVSPEATAPKRQSIAGSISAEAHNRLEDYRWANRLSKAEVLETAITHFLDAQDASKS